MVAGCDGADEGGVDDGDGCLTDEEKAWWRGHGCDAG